MMRYVACGDRNAGWILTALLISASLIVLAGCGDTRPQQPGGETAPGVAATLNNLGAALTWAGGICAAGGIALSLVALVWPPLATVAALLRFAAVGGSGVLATGCAIQFLANPWVLGLAVASCAGVVGWLHRDDIRRLFLAKRRSS